MKKVWIIVVAVLLAVIAGVGAYIASIDWNRYKDDIANQFSNISGKKLVFEGPFEFTMFPSPYMVAKNVKIYNPTSISEKPIAEIKEMVVDLSLMPLLQGVIDIRHMSFVEPLINVEFLDDETLNWQSDLSSNQIAQIRDTEIALNSLTLERGTLLFNDEELGINWQFDNFNAEIIAPNLLGPYRIEGSYLRDGSPEGFAVSLGQFTENFATSLNLVLTHPQSDTYLRFDGTFLLSNRSINGNLILESKFVKSFIEHNFPEISVDSEYDYPLSLSTEFNANKSQVDLSGITVKYGETVGAGNLLLPLGYENASYGKVAPKKQLEIAFNFTNLNLEPFAYFVKKMFSTYKDPENVFEMPEGLDVVGDIKAVNAVYNGQDVKDLSFSFDYKNQTMRINSLAAALPGDTSFDMNGEVYAQDEMPVYDAEMSFNSGDLTTALSWLDIKPQVSNVSFLRRGNGNVKISGTNKEMQISPFKLTLDKSTFEGQYAVKFGERNDSMLILDADMINFDNYISPMPKEEKEKGWINNINYRFRELGFLNDFEMYAKINLDLGIYESLPLENIELEATLAGGELAVKKFRIANAANMLIEALGDVSGFGKTPIFNDLRYNIITEDLTAWLSKMEMPLPNINLKKINEFDSEGLISGNFEKFVMDGNTSLGDLKISFKGDVFEKDNLWNVNGQFGAEHPDFVTLMQDFNINYNPQGYILGRFVANGSIKGNKNLFNVSDLVANIGVNEFKGNLVWDKSSSRPMITTTMEINNLELEKFLYNPIKKQQDMFVATNSEDVSLWGQPRWSTDKIDYSIYREFDVLANLQIGNFSFKKLNANNFSTVVKLNNGVLDLSEIKASAYGGDISGDISLNMNDSSVSMKGKASNLDVSNMNLAGQKYGVSKGGFSADGSINSSATSLFEFFTNLTGEVKVLIENALIKGWNLPAIYSDIEKRNLSDGLVVMVKDNLSSGESLVSSINLPISFNGGNFTFNDLQTMDENMALSASGSGSLKDWTMETTWNVKYDNLKNLPGIGFSFSGSMSNPIITPDVAALGGLYDARIEKIEADKKAKEEAERAEFQSLLDVQIQAAMVLKNELDSISKGLDDKREAAANMLMREKFDELKKQNDTLNIDINYVLGKAGVWEVSPNLLKDLELKNAQALQNLEKFKAALAQAYLDDIRMKCKEQHDVFVEIYNDYKNNIFNLNKSKDEILQQLKDIDVGYDLEKDPEIMQMQLNLSKLTGEVDAFDKLLQKEYQEQQNNATAELWEDYYNYISPLIEKNTENMKQIDEIIQKYISYATAKVEDKKAIYINKKREEEIKKKVEKNTGVISVKKTGKNLIVTRDIDEIEKAEEMKENEEVIILDFSKKDEEKEDANKAENIEGKVVKAKRKLR